MNRHEHYNLVSHVVQNLAPYDAILATHDKCRHFDIVACMSYSPHSVPTVPTVSSTRLQRGKRGDVEEDDCVFLPKPPTRMGIAFHRLEA